MSAETTVAALAVVASSATAIVSMVVTYRSQRSAIREQNLWQERTSTYLDLQGWVHAIYEWSDRGRKNDPPSPDLDTVMRARLLASPVVAHHFADMQRVVDQAVRARRDHDWEIFDDLRLQLSVGFAIDLNALMRDELEGRPNEFVATPNGQIRLRWRKRQALRFRAKRLSLLRRRAIDFDMPKGGDAR